MLKPSASVYPENRNSGIQKNRTGSRKTEQGIQKIVTKGSCYGKLDPLLLFPGSLVLFFWIPLLRFSGYTLALGLSIKECLSQEW